MKSYNRTCVESLNEILDNPVAVSSFAHAAMLSQNNHRLDYTQRDSLPICLCGYRPRSQDDQNVHVAEMTTAFLIASIRDYLSTGLC
jgi:hypothetical protein